jgi:hypothetical protein
MTYRLVKAEIAEMRIIEDENYVLEFARRNGQEYEPMHLYEVTCLCINTKTFEVRHSDLIHVLADSKAGAESQASCVFYKEHQTACNEDTMNVCHAKQVPFAIRGWSGNVF